MEHYLQVSKETGFSLEIIKAFHKRIACLNPRPGSLFLRGSNTQYIVPDGSFDWSFGKLNVHINEIGAPHLIISPFYQKMFRDQNCCEEIKTYISDRMDRALLLIKNIESRRETMRRITTFVAEYQEGWFKGTENSLKPMTLKMIAESAEVHESTVSRAIRGKYIRTPRGTFSLKSFFVRGYNTSQGTISIDAVKKIIAEMIAVEDAKHPLSDQKIVEVLSTKNLNIARRTVAKYREEMGIAPSSKRKNNN
jgi:RNA polymerase sigma-54 factor